MILGLAYGLGMFMGLADTQRIATPTDLAGLTGIFYALTYTGMIFPAVLTRLSEFFTYPQMLGFGTVMAIICLGVVSVTSRKL